MSASSLPAGGPFAGGRRLLFAGFGGLLALMIAAGAYTLLVLHQVRSSDARVRDLYSARTQALERVRNGIYQSAIIMRDYLLTTDPVVASAQVDRWRGVRERTDSALAETAALIDRAEDTPMRSLQTQVAGYWKLLDFIADMRKPGTNGNDTRVSGASYFTAELTGRRNSMLDLLDQIDQLSARELTASNAKLSSTFDTQRFRLAAMLVATLLAGMVLAVFTVRRTLTLEREVQRRYEEGERARDELKELSARLLSAQEEERRNISRELHDEVGQSLSALLMEAGNAAATVPAGSTEVRRHVESIKKLAEASVNVIRNMTLLLRPSMLDDFGLVPALEWQAREVSKRTGLRVQVAAEESAGELSDELKTCIYRVVQEALHNCARHSQARSVKVVVKQEPSRIILSVEDDGHGFDTRRVRGLGLVGMEERVHHLGGQFEVESRPGSGTRVAVELPLAS